VVWVWDAFSFCWGWRAFILLSLRCLSGCVGVESRWWRASDGYSSEFAMWWPVALGKRDDGVVLGD